MSITIKDIARLANVSIATVSRVVNNKPEGVGPETREKILKIIEEQNYHPNRIARGLVTKKTNILGLILPDIENPFFPTLARGAEDAARLYGYNVILCNSDNDREKEKAYFRILKESKVDGIICTSISKKSHSNMDLLIKSGIPFILLDRNVSSRHVPTVYSDSIFGMKQAVAHLIENGHKKIAYMSGPLGNSPAEQRLKGYESALREAGLSVDKKFIKIGEFDIQSGFNNMTELLKENREFTAVACANDLIAIGVIQALKSSGISVPGEISVTGYDDISIASIISPQLTTVAQPVYKMGHTAVDLLIRTIKGTATDSEVVIFRPTLVIRESTAKRSD